MRTARLFVMGLCLALSTTAHAGDWTRPEKSTVDPAVVTCPAGDALFRVEARNLYTACPNSSIMIDLCGCSSLRYAPTFPADGVFYYNACTPIGITDLNGIVLMPLRIGGLCSGAVRIYGDGILLANRPGLVSPDQNGDWVVNAADMAILNGKLGSSDPTGDFNGDGTVTAADVAIAQQHMGHAALVTVPVRGTTWGQIKILYR